MASEPGTGSLLRTLAATKPAGRLLELGTGTGIGTAWLLMGMDAHSYLDSVESDGAVQTIARRHLGHDPRVSFHLVDGAEFIMKAEAQYDRGGRSQITFENAFCNIMCERPPRLRRLGELRRLFMNAAATPPL